MSAARSFIVYSCGVFATLCTIAGVAAGVSFLGHQTWFGLDATMVAAQCVGLVLSAIVGTLLMVLVDKQMGKRWFLFLAMNLLVVSSISLLVHIFHAEQYMTRNGLDYPRLALFCMIWGMAGSFLSLLLSRWQAKWLLGVRVLTKQTWQQRGLGPDDFVRQHDLINNEQWLLNTVEELARKAELPATPEVGIWEDETVNAFATGPSRSRSLVAVSSGLLKTMPEDQIEAVLGHEIAHIANGDMVTMTLLQGTVNAFAMFASRAIGFIIQQASKSDSKWPYYVSQVLVEWVLMIFGALLLCWFSRQREYRADFGGAQLAGKEKMIGALASLQTEAERLEGSRKDKTKDNKESKDKVVEIKKRKPEAIAALMISSTPAWMELFSTHPPLEKRIERLNKL